MKVEILNLRFLQIMSSSVVKFIINVIDNNIIIIRKGNTCVKRNMTFYKNTYKNSNHQDIQEDIMKK